MEVWTMKSNQNVNENISSNLLIFVRTSKYRKGNHFHSFYLDISLIRLETF